MDKVFRLKNIGGSTIRFLFGSVEPGAILELGDRFLAQSLALLLPRQLALLDDRPRTTRKKHHGNPNTTGL